MRIDRYLAQFNYAESRTKAEKLVLEGNVYVDGIKVIKPSYDLDENIEHVIHVINSERFVSRGGLKLEGALKSFDIDVKGLHMLDVGASTGGFCDCLLQNGAACVTAVDAGKGQLHSRLRKDERVTLFEEYNARFLKKEDVGVFDGAVMDVSFISQSLIIPSLPEVMRDGGFLISLIKPQFEAGIRAVGKNGIVKSASDRELAVNRVVKAARENKLYLRGLIKSPILGGDGNIEYLGYFIKSEDEKTALENLNIRQICRE